MAAAIYVITQEDIRRSGFTTLPEIFRLVPGMQVARVNSSSWAVSVRGFNTLYTDKLLVLIDGRSVYNRVFSGVFWDAQDLMVSDIERIEVIRGPGGTAWGANAVNGVINIITKSAADTQGTAVEVSAGTVDRGSAAVRHGWTAGDVAFRVFGQWSDHGAGVTPAKTSAEDDWESSTAGGRTDWSHGAHTVMLQGAYMGARTRPHRLTVSEMFGLPTTDGMSQDDEGLVLGRWTRRFDGGSRLQIQGFTMSSHREESLLDMRERKSDVDVQYQTTAWSRHQIVGGGGYRRSALTTRSTFAVQMEGDTALVFNGFL